MKIKNVNVDQLNVSIFNCFLILKNNLLYLLVREESNWPVEWISLELFYLKGFMKQFFTYFGKCEFFFNFYSVGFFSLCWKVTLAY